MRLIYRILLRLFVALTVILTVWGFFFYIAIIDEINDEVDDSLEDYSENIITRALAKQTLPSHSDGSNNFYYLTEISPDDAKRRPHIRYFDENIYIADKEETEPARILKTIFKDIDGRYFELTVSTPTIEKEDLQEAILQWIVILYIILLCIVLILNIWIFYGSMRPLYILLKWLDRYTIGEQETPPDLKTNITEFKKLHAAAVRSVNRNNEIFEEQKQFIGNASHELQTPLAICQNRLEMLAENESLTEEQLQEINKVQETLSYIIRLNKSLLFLSKIENGQFPSNKEICLNEVIRKQAEDYQEIYSYKNITLHIEDKGILKIRMNDMLAISFITNLLRNAYIHNLPHGNIRISVSEQSLVFWNSGETVALDKEKIFQRFYQGKNPTKQSSGLGLSIVAAICKAYNIRINYTFREGHCFELYFPSSILSD